LPPPPQKKKHCTSNKEEKIGTILTERNILAGAGNTVACN
jgi:hypothetical protein